MDAPHLPELRYRPPHWASTTQAGPKRAIRLEVQKSGVLLQTITLSNAAIVGRLPTVDIPLENPSISRYHAVLQRSRDDALYIKDLKSTHGSSLNKKPLPPEVWVRVRVGDQLRFGMSERVFIADGDDEPSIIGSWSGVIDNLSSEQTRLEASEKLAMATLDPTLAQDTTTDAPRVARNPNPSRKGQAQLFKAESPASMKADLMNWFKKRDMEMDFHCHRNNRGTVVAEIELDLSYDGSSFQTVTGQGQTESAAKAAAMAAAYDLLKSMDILHAVSSLEHHKDQKRKIQQFYKDEEGDDDEDSYFDRTGAAEKKRLKRQKRAKPRSYLEAVQHLDQVQRSIRDVEKSLTSHGNRDEAQESETMDPLDAFMSGVNEQAGNQGTELLKSLKEEERRLLVLVDMSKPAAEHGLPPPPPPPPLVATPHKRGSFPSTVDTGVGCQPGTRQEESGRDSYGLRKATGAVEAEIEQQRHDPQDKREVDATDPSAPSPSPSGLENSAQEQHDHKQSAVPKRYGPTMPARLPSPGTTSPLTIEKDEDFVDLVVVHKNQTGDGRTHLNDKYGY